MYASDAILLLPRSHLISKLAVSLLLILKVAIVLVVIANNLQSIRPSCTLAFTFVLHPHRPSRPCNAFYGNKEVFSSLSHGESNYNTRNFKFAISSFKERQRELFDDIPVDDVRFRIAAEFLVSVLYEHTAGDLALKRCLRAYQRSLRDNPSLNKNDLKLKDMFSKLPSFTRDERQTNRKIFSDLIIGTSVMRLRHWYVYMQHYVQTTLQPECINLEHIVGVEPWMNQYIQMSKNIDMKTKYSSSFSKDTANRTYIKESKLEVVKELVFLHAHYMKSCSNPYVENQIHCTSEMEMNIIWPQNNVHRIAIQQSLPSFVVRMWINQYGLGAAQTIAKMANSPGSITIRRNSLCCKTDNDLIHRLKDECESINISEGERSTHIDFNAYIPKVRGFKTPSGCIRLEINNYIKVNNTTCENNFDEVQTKPLSLWSLKTWSQDGCFEVQDVGSQLIVDATEVQFNDVAIDYCAGNGGKTLALASKMWESKNVNTQLHSYSIPSAMSTFKTQSVNSTFGTIIAHDVVESRLAQLRGSLERARLHTGMKNHFLSKGSSDYNNAVQMEDIPHIITTSNTSSLSPGIADVVLVDAPCSSLGVLRRRPGHRWTLTQNAICDEFPKLQLDILKNASLYVKPGGGRLIYATCSISQEENENVVRKFESFKGFDEMWERWNYNYKDDGSHSVSILPHIHGGDGFFFARWKKK